MLEISTNNLKTRKKVTIDGHLFTVRKFSNLEQLDISQYKRRSEKIVELAKQTKDIETLEKLDDEADEMSRKILNIFINLFDDGGDQSKSKALIDSLDYEGITEMLEQIFKGENG